MNNMKTFGGIGQEYSGFDQSEILLQSIPYDGTSTWGKGADRGFEAFVEAAENMELYDIETESEVYRHGIHMLPGITEKTSPEAVYSVVLEQTQKLLSSNKFLTFFGGEHSISIGIIDAYNCGVMYRIECWLEALGIDFSMHPKPDKCLMHATGRCTGDISVTLENLCK